MKLGQKLAIGLIRARLNLTGVISPERAGRMAFDIFCTPFRKSRKKQPGIFKKAERISFSLNSQTVRGYRWNTGREKKILITHGFESTCYNFDRYVSPLLKQGFEVIAFDAPGHGKSEGKRLDVLTYIKMIEEIVARYGPVYGIMGHSFGGLATALWAEKAGYASPEKLIWIAPATETTTAIKTFYRFLQLSDPIKNAFEARIVAVSGHEPAWFSIPRALKNISAEVLWIHDENDEITPISDVKKVMEAGAPNIRFMITQGLGHRQIYRENKVIKAVTDFFSNGKEEVSV